MSKLNSNHSRDKLVCLFVCLSFGLAVVSKVCGPVARQCHRLVAVCREAFMGTSVRRKRLKMMMQIDIVHRILALSLTLCSASMLLFFFPRAKNEK